MKKVVLRGKFRMNSGVLRVERGGSGAKAPLLAARPSTVQETGQIPDCGFYLPVSVSRNATVGVKEVAQFSHSGQLVYMRGIWSLLVSSE